MNIFGFTLSAADLWLLGIAGVLVMLLLGVYVPAAIKRRHDASAAYRLAFDDVLLNLIENPDCPLAQIAFGCHPQHLAAINKYRRFVSFWRRRRFDCDVEHYKEAYNKARENGDVFAIALSENTEAAREKRRHYSSAIQRLIYHA